MSLFSRLSLALLSHSCVTLGESICLSEPIYLIYKVGLIVFTYLASGCGNGKALGKRQGTGHALWSMGP